MKVTNQELYSQRT